LSLTSLNLANVLVSKSLATSLFTTVEELLLLKFSTMITNFIISDAAEDIRDALFPQ